MVLSSDVNRVQFHDGRGDWTLIGECTVCFVDEMLLEELFTWLDEKSSPHQCSICALQSLRLEDNDTT